MNEDSSKYSLYYYTNMVQISLIIKTTRNLNQEYFRLFFVPQNNKYMMEFTNAQWGDYRDIYVYKNDIEVSSNLQMIL